jgi:lysophospholipase L1-like esterase
VTKPLPLVNVPAVFIGDSITQFWGGFVNFPADQWTNQGISGEICGDMLARFQTDVIAVHPATVHILCGTNDIIHQAADAATTESNISAMVAQAKAANIQVILGTVTPVRPGLGMNFPTGSNDAITALNVWIRSYATQQQIPIADYNAALSASDGMIVPADTTDGVHPNAAGYAIMTNMVQQLFAE